MAQQLYHAFTIIPNLRYRVIAISEQRVGGQWIQMAGTELATFSPRRSRDPRMPQRPPPPPPPASEDQVDPESPPEKPAQPSPSDAPGPIRIQRRSRRTPKQSRTPPPRPSQPPFARQGPEYHDQIVPPWGELAADIWFASPICADSPAHSGVVCGQCGGRPDCCKYMVYLELDRHTMGRCPLCLYEGPQ
jgi:hypothetical protein